MEREVLFISVLLFFPSEKKENERSQRICRWQDLVTLTPLFKKKTKTYIYWDGDVLLTWWFVTIIYRWPHGNFWTGNPLEASSAEVSYSLVAIAHAIKLLVWWGVCSTEECWDKELQRLLSIFCISSNLALCCKNSVQQSPESAPSLLMPF